ncbi:MAG TPA: choice-of-anchor Q domain-containing protein [Tepidisphaeraceae bacterium]
MLTAVLVNTIIDGIFPPNTGIISLRSAIATANSSTTPTTITFDPTVFATPQTIVLNGTDFTLNGTQPTTITGPVAGVTIDGHALGAVFTISGANANLSGLTITNGSNRGISNSATLTLTNVSVSSNAGGGLHNSGSATLNNVTISNNTQAVSGGGIYNDINASLTLTSGVISGNTCSGNGQSGGGISNFDGSITLADVTVSANTSSYDGGGIFSLGRATLTRVNVSGNSSAGYGGGIDNGAGPMTLANVTLSGNTASTSSGGGIYNGGFSVSGPGGSFNTGTLTLTNATAVGNSANIGGGIYNVSGSTVTVSNTIVAGNVLAGTGGSGPDASGSLNSLGFNLVGKTDGSGGSWNADDLTGTVLQPLNPMLSALGNYGGPTQTMVPLPGSRAIDAGFNAFAVDANDQPLTTDQRGLPRIYNARVDIGAVEFQPQPINGTSGSDSMTLEQDADHQHVDWTVDTTSGQFIIADPEGAIINGGGGSDTITLDYTNGNPLPHLLHLNGTFTINGLAGSNPLAGTTLEIGKSTVYVNYVGGASPAAFIQQYLANGYDGGAWTGSPTASTGVITSAAAASGPLNTFGVGFADSADGVVVGQPANTVELRYTVMGDANLDGVVNALDAVQMARNYMIAGRSAWDLGNFNYDSVIDISDAMILQKNFNAKVTAAAVSAASTTVGVTPGAAAISSTSGGSTLLVATNPPTGPGGGDGNGSKAAVNVTPDDKHRVKRGRLDRRDDRRR